MFLLFHHEIICFDFPSLCGVFFIFRFFFLKDLGVFNVTDPDTCIPNTCIYIYIVGLCVLSF